MRLILIVVVLGVFPLYGDKPCFARLVSRINEGINRGTVASASRTALIEVVRITDYFKSNKRRSCIRWDREHFDKFVQDVIEDCKNSVGIVSD